MKYTTTLGTFGVSVLLTLGACSSTPSSTPTPPPVVTPSNPTPSVEQCYLAARQSGATHSEAVATCGNPQ